MLLNADLTVRAVVHAATLEWITSPSPGVHRRMLYRVGDEKALATSIVRYDANSRFPRHEHPGGEEILVLEGVFQDESADYPAGTYIRNPPGSGHAPHCDAGCTIFVKLRQFAPDDDCLVRRWTDETNANSPLPIQGSSTIELFDSAREHVRIMSWGPGASMECANPDGLELLVLQGGFSDETEDFQHLSWLRLPPSMAFSARSDKSGCRVWLKTGHLGRSVPLGHTDAA